MTDHKKAHEEYDITTENRHDHYEHSNTLALFFSSLTMKRSLKCEQGNVDLPFFPKRKRGTGFKLQKHTPFVYL